MKDFSFIGKKIATYAVVFAVALWAINVPVFLNGLQAASGEGEAFLKINHMAGKNKINSGAYYNFEVELRVGASGIAADGNGNVDVVVPNGFTPPQSSSSTYPGYVSVGTSNMGATLIATTTGQTITIITSGDPLINNDMIWIQYGDTSGGPIAAAQAPTTTGTYGFAVKTDDAGGSAVEISGSPINIQVGFPVMISEIQVNGGGTASNEFVEIYNNSDSPIDLAGWDIVFGNANATSAIIWSEVASINLSNHLIIPGFGYALFSNYAYAPETVTANINTPTSSTLSFDAAGGYIAIRNTGNTVVDYVGYGTLFNSFLAEGGQAASNPGNGTLERKAFGNSTAVDMASGGPGATMGNGWDSDNNYLDFVTQSVAVPQNISSPTEQPQGGPPGGGGPIIMHMPVNTAPTGSSLTMTAQMGDPQTEMTQLGAEVHYMVGDGSPINNLTTNYLTAVGTLQSNGFFQFTIPQNIIDLSTSSGAYYYLKLVGNGGTRYMSASPSADMAGNEAQVAQNPFIINCQNPSGWAKHNISGTIDDSIGTSVENALIFIEGTGYTATTAADGTYTLSNVRDGIHNLIITKSGYFDEWIMDLYLNGANLTGVNKTLVQGMGGGMTGDSEKPFVIFTGPPDGMMGIPTGDVNFKIFIGFSKDLDSSSVNNTNIYLTTDGTTPISSTVLYDNDSSNNASQGLPPDNYLGIVSPPSGGFAANTTYYLVMTGSVRDNVGNALQGNRNSGGHVISFTTGGDYSGQQDWQNFGTGDMKPPFVMGTVPADSAFNVVPNTKIIINFAEALMDNTANSTNIKLYKVVYSNNVETETAISFTASLDTTKKIVTLTPASSLVAGKYIVVVTGAVQSATGVYLGDPMQQQNTSNYRFFKSHFEVGANISADIQPPTIQGTWPSDNATDISVSPGSFNIQFSEGMDPSSINLNTITLKRGTTKVTCGVNYDSMSKSATLVPKVVLATNAIYTLTIEGNGTSTTESSVKDVVGNSMAADYIVTFTTSALADTQSPAIMFANGDEFSLAITFSEPMNSAKITDADNYKKSVLNPANYKIKYGVAGVDFYSGGGTVINLSSSKLEYDDMGNTIIIKNIGLTASDIGKQYFVDISTSSVYSVNNYGVADLSGNYSSGVTTTSMFVTPIKNSLDTKGMLGPMNGGGGGMTGSMGPNMGQMGMMKAGVFPMNAMAGQTTIYFVDLPTSNQILNGYKIVLTFPVGFDVSGAKKDPNSPINNDINEWNNGTITFGSAAESSGGANNDGVIVDTANRQITITMAVTGTTPSSDFIHLDLAGIVNSSIPRDFNTSGYSVDMKILKADGSLLESINPMPFFINSGGSSNLVVSLSGILGADVDGSGDEVKIFLGSPMSGPMDKVITVDTDGHGTTTISGLPEGEYMIFTNPSVTFDGGADYAGMSMPSPIRLTTGTTTRIITLTKQTAGVGVAEITVNITGVFGTDDIDVFAGSPSGFKVKTITDAGTNPSNIKLYLGNGDWMVGMGPAMPKGPMSGPPPMPDWMPPMPVSIRVSNNATVVEETSGTNNDGAIAFNIGSANIQVIGYVKDDSNNAIADAEVWAYQPMGTGMGSHTKTDTNGKFTLKLSQVGNYTTGTFKPGLPSVPEKSIIVKTNTGASDGNATADVYFNNALVTASNLFTVKIKKPGNTISGKVTDGTNSISYAPVWADKANGQGHADTMTDSSGNYILYVEDGTWVVKSFIPNYGNIEPKTVIISNSSVTQNLAPDSSVTYCSIAGTVTIGGQAQTYMPIRAVQYNNNGAYTGKDYGGQTAGDGTYSISVQCSNKYRVDTWTPEYGEVGVNIDEVANSPANVSVAGSNVTGKDITINANVLRIVTLNFINATSTQSAFLNIDGVEFASTSTPPKFTGFHKSVRFDTLTATNTVKLADGDYFFFVDVPGLGSYIPDQGSLDVDKGDIVVSATRTVNFTLPDITNTANVAQISGTVTDGSGPIANAWVWVGKPSSGFHNGTQTATDGTYSLTIPSGTGYKMGADKPGYLSDEPIDLIASGTMASTDFTLTAGSVKISGRLYSDLDSDSAYDSGEEVPNGFVRAETADGSKKAHAPADGSGYYELTVNDGSWKVYGMSPGYQETRYGSTITIAGSNATANIKLTSNSNWENKSKMKQITPASGGSMDDTSQDESTGNKDGTGVKLTLPPNALGNSTSAGNINANNTTAVKTNSFDPLNDTGIQITASDNSGQAITSLNDYIDLEMVLYKADIESSITNNQTTYTQLKTTNNGYWDSTVNDWVKLETTRNAYYKNVSETEWTLFASSTATSSFESFIDTLPGSYEDYKLVYTSKTNHFTIFGTISPTDAVAPSTPSGLALTASNGSVAITWTANSEEDFLEYQVFRGATSGFTCNDDSQINISAITSASYTDSAPTDNTSYSYYYKISAVDNSGNISTCSSGVLASYTYAGGGSGSNAGGSNITPNCTSVTYGEWKNTCDNGWQYRDITLQAPTNCILTSSQEGSRKKACQAVAEEKEVTNKEIAEEIKETAKEMVNEFTQKITVITNEAIEVFKANINTFLNKFGLKRDLIKEKQSTDRYVKALIKEMKNLRSETKYALTNFIAYGTETTKALGEGERAGVVNSYKAAFGKLPSAENEWSDVIKIANGRWPSETNKEVEEKATIEFKRIYKRNPDRKNPKDDAAITVMAYGLRPAIRNLDSEKAALKIFKSIYDHAPYTAFGWDVVRAIAYSGAKR